MGARDGCDRFSVYPRYTRTRARVTALYGSPVTCVTHSILGVENKALRSSNTATPLPTWRKLGAIERKTAVAAMKNDGCDVSAELAGFQNPPENGQASDRVTGAHAIDNRRKAYYFK